MIKFTFSEPLKSIDEMEQVNLTSISNDNVFNVKYQTYVEDEGADDEQESDTQTNQTKLKVPKL